MRVKILLLPVLIFISGCADKPMEERADTYLIFFDTNSAALSPAGYEAVTSAATTIQFKHPAHIIIAGPTSIDAAGFETNLAEPRVAAVEQALIADGVSHDLLSRAALNAKEAGFGASGNRRIEIRLLKN